MSEKYSISFDGEDFEGVYESVEDAIAEAQSYAECSHFFVGRCVAPVPPENLFSLEDWFDAVSHSYEYDVEFPFDSGRPNQNQCVELETTIRAAMTAWLDRYGLRPTHLDVDVATEFEVVDGAAIEKHSGPIESFRFR